MPPSGRVPTRDPLKQAPLLVPVDPAGNGPQVSLMEAQGAEVAEQFGVSAQVIGRSLGAALRRLAKDGVKPSDLRQAARWQQNQSEAMATAGTGRRKGTPSHSWVQHPPDGAPE